MDLTLPYKATHGFDALYGLEIVSADAETVRGTVSVGDEHKQPAGLVHGGVYASIAESLASVGTMLQVDSDGKAAMGLANNTSFMRPITGGTIHAEAVVLHRGRTTWVWDVRISDDEGRLCALTRMTVAVRERRG
jgi:1,4-dihydroxy-2-naphthoyl-CoA hydrolase